ncbi:MAG: hypothetical protein Q4C22_03665, partial [Bacillota bacterium]|nr:hypothetical protein [Bacillota bacterium]
MRRTSVVLCLSLIIVVLSGAFAFGAGFELESSYPEEGSSNSVIQNVAVKLTFTANITSEEAQALNQDCFSITDADGEEVAFTPTYDAEKYPNDVWLMVSPGIRLTSDTEYAVVISPDMQSSDGDLLGEEVVVSFKTRNIERDNNVNMILMVGMMVGLIAFGSFETKRQLKKQAESKGETEKVNPYKEAKKTGKSVEDIVAKTEKQKARVAKKYEASQARRVKDAESREEEDELPEGVKRVREPRSVKAAG